MARRLPKAPKIEKSCSPEASNVLQPWYSLEDPSWTCQYINIINCKTRCPFPAHVIKEEPVRCPRSCFPSLSAFIRWQGSIKLFFYVMSPDCPTARRMYNHVCSISTILVWKHIISIDIYIYVCVCVSMIYGNILWYIHIQCTHNIYRVFPLLRQTQSTLPSCFEHIADQSPRCTTCPVHFASQLHQTNTMTCMTGENISHHQFTAIHCVDYLIININQ